MGFGARPPSQSIFSSENHMIDCALWRYPPSNPLCYRCETEGQESQVTSQGPEACK